ncbi:hypothetical protein A5707_11315 [Mycobacterium kyorinense]|uniref:Intersectin-EH binding protein Ibp1 n=1 Tax=Mycobacterium kyorinense TaxID=487514 RepID=A0A1A2ZVG3_9MYCO|nr:hypothetical protein [Mycobacterium kyorinense]OBI53457.1 hypothetical protein A5707_11315 [Mycobacterium kyorinense]
MKTLGVAAAAAIAFAPFAVLPVQQAPPAHAGPLCPNEPNLAGNPRYEQLHQQCLQAEQNQNECFDATGCTPGDPCVVGSPIERGACADARAAGQLPK